MGDTQMSVGDSLRHALDTLVDEVGEDGNTKTEPTNADVDATQKTKNDRGRSGQATSVDRPKASNDNYKTESHKFTEQEDRAGLRKVENHASWRDVYRACHVGVGIDE